MKVSAVINVSGSTGCATQNAAQAVTNAGALAFRVGRLSIGERGKQHESCKSADNELLYHTNLQLRGMFTYLLESGV